MTEPDRLSAADLPAGAVRRSGDWAVGNRGTAADGNPYFAVSRRCRHQLADLSEGSIDADGCLVCPWHQSRYDVRTGEMVEGPRGFLGQRRAGSDGEQGGCAHDHEQPARGHLDTDHRSTVPTTRWVRRPRAG